MQSVRQAVPYKPKSTKRHYHQERSAIPLLLPAFILLLLFMYFPSFAAMVYSFTDWNGLDSPNFIGFNNFIELFRDPVMHISTRNVAIWTIGGLVTGLISPLLTAVLIYHIRSAKLQYLYRVLFVIPMVVPGVVVLMIWQFIYDPNIGMLNALLKELNLTAIAGNWLGDPHIALYALICIGFPWIAGFNLLIYYAGLQNIPNEVLESAMLDGTNIFSRFWSIELPLVMGQVKLLAILTTIHVLQNVTGPLLLTYGGPGYSTYVPGLYMYQKAFQNGEFGVAMAIAMLLFIVILVLTILNMTFIRSSTEHEA
jgi:raffinose/stachyose/melibiose transport system permease protein